VQGKKRVRGRKKKVQEGRKRRKDKKEKTGGKSWAWHGTAGLVHGPAGAGILAVGCWSATRILAISLGSLLLAKLNRMAPLVGKNGCEAEKGPAQVEASLWLLQWLFSASFTSIIQHSFNGCG